MQLALRRGAPVGATVWQRIACAVIRARLASDYCHGGVVIDGHLFHATAARGLHRLGPDEWEPARWELFDVDPGVGDAVWLFMKHDGARYDWLSLLAFVGPRVRDSSRMYCFEWCWLAMTGDEPAARVTPEMLLRLTVEHRSA